MKDVKMLVLIYKGLLLIRLDFVLVLKMYFVL